jgi:hypothetical protein
MKARFIVELELPDDATAEDARDYVETEVKSGHGHLQSLNPFNELEGDPMWGLNPDTVAVSTLDDPTLPDKEACMHKPDLATLSIPQDVHPMMSDDGRIRLIIDVWCAKCGTSGAFATTVDPQDIDW